MVCVIQGEFYSAKNHTDPPFQVQNFSLTRQDSYMLSAGMSEFTANSVSYSYFSTGVLVARITDKMVSFSAVCLCLFFCY